MDKIRVKKPHNLWLNKVRSMGNITDIPPETALYFSRTKDIKEIVEVKSLRHNAFIASLRSNAFKPAGENFKYAFYIKSNKKWSDLI